MSRQTGHEESAMRYLLGTLSEEDRARVEEGYFSDDQKFEELEIAEDELIDRYVRGELSNADRDRFEATVGSSLRLTERVQFARLWKDKLAASPVDRATVGTDQSDRQQTSWLNKLFGFSAQSRTPRLAVAFGVLLVLIGGIALFAGWLRLREESRRLAAQQAALEQRQRELDKQAADLKSQRDQLVTQVPQPTPTDTPLPSPPLDESSPRPSTRFIALTLSPGSTRGAGASNDIRLPPSTGEVRLTLNLSDSDYTSYQAIIFDADRRRVLTSDPLRHRQSRSGPVLTFSVPANKLPPGDYSITLIGRTPSETTEIADYQFRVIR